MRKFSLSLAIASMLLSLPARADARGEPQTESGIPEATSQGPLDIDKTERATVRLVLMDVVVVDRQGRTIDGLDAGDFEVVAAGGPVEVDTLDVSCERRVDDATRIAGAGGSSAGDLPPRRIALVIDYLHMPGELREGVLDRMNRFIKDEKTVGDEVMLVALTGGLRIEQPFTADTEQLLRSLKRVRYDVSLWNGNFRHLNEFGWVQGLESLFDVLGTFEGPKAVVLFSNMQDVPLDLQFERLAAIASASRCAVYPVDPLGLPTPLMLAQYRSGAG